jgi:hypothetical protein
LKQLKYYPKLKIVALEGTTIKAFGEKEVLDVFNS